LFAPLPSLTLLDIPSRIVVASLLQNTVIDLLRLQHSASPNQSWSAILIAVASFGSMLYPELIPLVLTGQIIAALWLLRDEQKSRDLKGAVKAAQKRIDELMAEIVEKRS
jgi:MFS superfamily sulfate permease-like transporter